VAIKAMTVNNLDVAIIELRGAFISNKDTDELKSKAADLFEQGNRKLIIDLSSATYINSLGIGALVNIYTMYTKGQGKIKLCQMAKGIQNIFVITKLISVFDVEETREEALKEFQTNGTPKTN
jgi:anti-sigma B factor antagonist